jgi:hypothetical protein
LSHKMIFVTDKTGMDVAAVAIPFQPKDVGGFD